MNCSSWLIAGMSTAAVRAAHHKFSVIRLEGTARRRGNMTARRRECLKPVVRPTVSGISSIKGKGYFTVNVENYQPREGLREGSAPAHSMEAESQSDVATLSGVGLLERPGVVPLGVHHLAGAEQLLLRAAHPLVDRRARVTLAQEQRRPCRHERLPVPASSTNSTTTCLGAHLGVAQHERAEELAIVAEPVLGHAAPPDRAVERTIRRGSERRGEQRGKIGALPTHAASLVRRAHLQQQPREVRVRRARAGLLRGAQPEVAAREYQQPACGRARER